MYIRYILWNKIFLDVYFVYFDVEEREDEEFE